MKFYGIISDQIQMKNLLNLSSIFSKLSRECILKLEPGCINFIITQQMAQILPYTWCETEKNVMFSQYTMSGVTDTYNKIYLQINPLDLTAALTPVKNIIHLVKFKLAQKDYPCLTVELQVTPTKSLNNRIMTHDVPVQIIPIEEWDECSVPEVPDFHLTISMPQLRSTKVLIDKLKKLAPYVMCVASSEGELSFFIETDMTTVVCEYKALKIEYYKKNQVIDDDSTKITCNVDLKKLSTLLNSIQFQPYKMSLSVAQDQLIRIVLTLHDDININCVIPSISI